jgi:hypothetical protein
MLNVRRSFALVALVSVLATIPVWIPDFPPMTDLPQHAAQIAMLREMGQETFPYRHLFEINWFTPYLFGYLLVYALTGLVGIVAACKVVVSLAIAGIPIATAALILETDGDPQWALLAVPAMYGFDYQWGFLNFLVAVPLGLLFLALVFRVTTAPSRRGWIGIAVAINALFFCHAMIALACGAAAAVIVMLRAGSGRSRLLHLSSLASVIPVMVVWGSLTSGHPDAQQPIGWDLGWLRTTDDYYSWHASWAQDGFGWGRLAGILPRVLGGRPSAAVYGFGALLILLPFLFRAKLRRDASCWAPLAVCAVILFFAPSSTFGAYYIAERFAIFVLPLYALVIEGRTMPKVPATFGMVAMVAVWMTAVVSRTTVYEREADGFTQVLAQMAPGERVMSFPFERDSAAAITPLFLHYPAWYAAVDGGIVDPSLAVHHVELVRYTSDAEIGMRFWGFEFTPENFDWDYFGASLFRYFVAREASNPAPHMFEDVPCLPRLVGHARAWWLYENPPQCRE